MDRTDFRKDDIFIFPNREIPVPDIGKIGRHFETMAKILIRDYLILRYYNDQPSLMAFLNGMERDMIKLALLLSSGVQKQAAELLGVKPTCLFEKIKRYDLKSGRGSARKNPHDRLGELGLFFTDLNQILS